jgi:uncharacterized protein (DUF488 family)
MLNSQRLFTIGHSNHELARLIELLQAAGVTAVADVRSQPFSQRLPQFNRPELARGLEDHGIAYAFFGDSLGGRPRSPSLYDADGRVNYERMRTTTPFRNGLDQLIAALDEHRVALLCSEEDPLDCHRGLMITPALAERGFTPLHLRKDGSAETTLEMEQRLLDETGVGKDILDGLFAAVVTDEERRQLLQEAYRLMARRKAFRLRPDVAEQETDGTNHALGEE